MNYKKKNLLIAWNFYKICSEQMKNISIYTKIYRNKMFLLISEKSLIPPNYHLFFPSLKYSKHLAKFKVSFHNGNQNYHENSWLLL